MSLALVLSMATATAGSCAGGGPGDLAVDPAAATEYGPAERTVAVVTTACGSSSAAIGSAVRLDTTLVLTAAHVIAGAGSVAVVDEDHLPVDREWPGFSPVTLFDDAVAATVLAFDPGRDLALLEIDRTPVEGVDALEFGRPDLGTLAVGEVIEIRGAAAPPVDGTVAQPTTIEVDEVRGRSRVDRDGYRLDAATGRGDSGAGVWSADGRLVGLVFAVSVADDTRTWAVSGREIEDFLATTGDGPPSSYRCDERTSRLVVGP